MMRYLLATVIFLVLNFVSFKGIVLAQSVAISSSAGEVINIKYESVNPGSDLRYSFKRFKEKIILLLLSPFPPQKTDYYKNLINIRLAELKYVTDKKDIANIQNVTQRYFTTAGELTDLILASQSLTSQKREVKALLASHLIVVDQLKKSYNDTTAEWRFMEHVSDYLKNYISRFND